MFKKILSADTSGLELQIIVSDNNSTDGTREILSSFKHSKVKCLFRDKNNGKGANIKNALKQAEGDIILFQDSDLELDPHDSREMYELIKVHPEMKVLFGSRFLSGKLRANKNFLNEIFVRLNSIIFNVFFLESITDLHCGTKIISKEVVDKIKLSINDFGIEIDPDIFHDGFPPNNTTTYLVRVSHAISFC